MRVELLPLDTVLCGNHWVLELSLLVCAPCAQLDLRLCGKIATLMQFSKVSKLWFGYKNTMSFSLLFEEFTFCLNLLYAIGFCIEWSSIEYNLWVLCSERANFQSRLFTLTDK